MLAGTLARRAVRALLILVGVSIVGFGSNTLMERKLVDSEHRLPGSNVAGYDSPPARRYIGLPENAAVRAIRDDGLHARLAWRDGEAQIGTDDRRKDSVDLYIQDGVVVDARFG